MIDASVASADAAGEAPAQASCVPWSLRLLDAVAAPPWLVGVGISVLLLSVMLLAEAASGELGRMLRGESVAWKASEYRFSLVFALLAGYLPPAFAFTLRAGRRAFAGMRPALNGASEELDAQGGRIGSFDRGALRWAGLAGVAVALLLPVATDLTTGVYRITAMNTASAGHRVLVPVLLWLFARITYVCIQDSRRLVALSRERLEIDLLDLSPLTPLTAYGLQNGLVFLGAFSILSFMLVDWASRPGLLWVLAGVMLAALAFACSSLLLPVRGARSVIRQAKRDELAWCRAEIRRRRAALERGGAAPEGGSLDELVAYHELVRGVHEWPFDAQTLTRFALYLGIPVGSWLGGAMVERLVDQLLD